MQLSLHVVLFCIVFSFRSQQTDIGDVLVLTKPIGTHIACLASQWLTHDKEKWSRIKVVISEEEVEKAYQRALAVMSRLNKSGRY